MTRDALMMCVAPQPKARIRAGFFTCGGGGRPVLDRLGRIARNRSTANPRMRHAIPPNHTWPWCRTVIDMDVGTLIMVGMSSVGAFWGMVKLMFVQYEKRQEDRFTALGETISEQKEELDTHMAKQDGVLGEIRRVETNALSEIRKVENDLNQCRIDAAQRYMTKEDAKNRHQEIIDAIKGLANRIDTLHIKP